MLRAQNGIYSIKVALLAERGVIHYDPAFWTVEKLISVGPFYHSYHFRGLTFHYRRFLTSALMPPTYLPSALIWLLFGYTA
jgi:hypothetical protein